MVLQHRRKLLQAQIIAVLTALLSVPVPLLMPLLVDEVLLKQPGVIVSAANTVFPLQWQGPTLYILSIMVLVLLLRLSSLLLGVWQMRQFTYIAKDITYRLRRGLLLHLGQVSITKYETLGSGAIASHFVTDLDTVDQFIGTTISKFVIAALTIIGVAIVLLWVNWQLGLFILLMNPIVVYFTMVLSKKVKHWKYNENTAYEIFQGTLTETLNAIQQIRAANRESHYIQRLIILAKKVRNHSTTYTWKSEMTNRLSFLLFLCGVEVFRATAMLLVVFSDLTIGQMFAVFSYLWFMMGPAQEVLNIRYALVSAKGALTRLNRLLDLEIEPHYPHRKNPFVDKLTTSVSLNNICFAYGNNPQVLSHISLSIKAGEKIALVGTSGGGKTTLVQILLGLHIPQSGNICFDNIPATEIGFDIIRNNIAIVLQHPALFNDSVRANITLGRDISDNQIWRALEIAQLRKTVEEMKQRLDTSIGYQGIRLSGGQQQRLAIARMIVTDPKIVILDEATSALDIETESRLYQALGEFLKGRTTIIIAHRLSAVRQAERVYVFDNGQVIEEGRPNELACNNGFYTNLYGIA
ncbi:ABC transporter ATP-binding protein [Candidatus Nitrosoglobus terrae]|uniref:ABC transporter ATP-binding protein n=1 Tax=Candidatus Nitrosoglobus terrae TaxID=1630141 RepID=A0A1Q2SML3_9GAMM|nr:ABC transporter ATP-binding protein [Candidatus Nitrosoglobus terrae]BAW80370.1 ABC transporter ATP-binding protein [Candidatus Nitrosoglobus terrae]